MQAAFSQDVFRRIMQPRSLAILGMSSKPNTAGHAVLQNWLLNGFGGPIHLIGRSDGEIEGLPINGDMAALPDNVDLAVLAMPAAGIGAALEACVAKKIGVAIVFASGFAELGDAERAEQDRIGALAREGGVAVIGPNCLGFTNNVDGFVVGFAGIAKVPTIAPGTRDAVAVVAQSGGLGGHMRAGLEARNVPVSYNISTGNEMGLGLGDFVGYLLEDEATRVVMIYAEHIRQPAAFLAAARKARAAGKAIAMLHPGRGVRAKEAAKSHTGALAGDYAVMKAQVERAGVLFADTLDELLDATEILSHYATPPRGGLGVMTFSGAFCGIVHDFCEDMGVPVPPLSPETEAYLKPIVPSFIPPKNPLDLGTQPIWQPELVDIGVTALLQEPRIGAVAISMPPGAPSSTVGYLRHVIAARDKSQKPLALALLNDGQPLPPELTQLAREQKIVLSRSSDRILRAMGALIKWGNRPVAPPPSPPRAFPAMPALTSGTQPEWLGKKVLAAAGIAVPRGGLAETPDQAVKIAGEIGFPVALKAQAGALAHKTEAGGVLLGLADEGAVREGWTRLIANVERAQPGLRLDGVLVETIAPRGLEFVVGAKRDPHWGAVILVGLGGILVEALRDVRLIPVDATREEIVADLDKLKTAKLLHGFRAMPPVDVEAIADVAMALGQLMQGRPDIVEIDVNPLMVHPRGRGATALDALIVTA